MRTSVTASAVFALALAVLLPVSGCSTSNADAPKAIEKVCTKTACDEKMSRDDSSCSRCLDACTSASYDCDPSSACELSCSSNDAPTCSDSERSQCVSQNFVVRVNDAPSSEVLAACNRMFDHLDSCKLEIPGKTRSICAVWAKAEKPENAATYDCVANKGCKDDLSDCATPVTTLGDEFCSVAATCKGTPMDMKSCQYFWGKDLNGNGTVWRDDVLALDKTCLGYASCDDLGSCHEAWKAAVGL